MIEVTRHGEVTRLRCATRASRAFSYEVSAYVTRGVLVDSGFPAMGAALEAWLATTPIAGALLTHHHEDHAGNADRLVRRGIPIGLAAETLELIRRPAPIGLYRRLCWGSARPLPRDPVPFAHPALTMIRTPGHSADHHVIWDAERETVFGGDLFIGVKVRIAHPGEDIRGQAVQLRRIAALAPVRFFDAHRGPVDQPVPSLLAKAQWIDETVGAIERLADAGRDPRSIERAVLGRGDLTGWFSRGDYAMRNLVESVLATRQRPPGDAGAPVRSGARSTGAAPAQ